MRNTLELTQQTSPPPSTMATLTSIASKSALVQQWWFGDIQSGTWDERHSLVQRFCSFVRSNQSWKSMATRRCRHVDEFIAPSHYYQARMLEDKRPVVQDWVSQSATVCMWSDQFKMEHHRFEFAVFFRACSWFYSPDECLKEKRITIPDFKSVIWLGVACLRIRCVIYEQWSRAS